MGQAQSCVHLCPSSSRVFGVDRYLLMEIPRGNSGLHIRTWASHSLPESQLPSFPNLCPHSADLFNSTLNEWGFLPAVCLQTTRADSHSQGESKSKAVASGESPFPLSDDQVQLRLHADLPGTWILSTPTLDDVDTHRGSLPQPWFVLAAPAVRCVISLALKVMLPAVSSPCCMRVA